MAKKINDCDHTLIEINTKTGGYWVEHVRPDGSTDEAFTDKLKHATPPKTGRCLDCGKRVPNPQVGLW